jgi:pyruvate dehydrogenase E2 component (dihydrolipoamide acetyltransferase)
MPKLSDTMTTGKIISWIKNEGDQIEAGEAIAEVETDKATMELECFDDGTLLKILASVDSAVPIGGPIAIIGKKGEDVEQMTKQALAGGTVASAETKQAAPKSKSEAEVSATSSPAPAAPAPETKPSGEGGKLRVSPVAQRIAAEENIDVRTIQGSGPSGRIIKRDIEAYLAQTPGAAAPVSAPTTAGEGLTYEDIQLSGIRATMARRLPESLGPVPHFYLEIDVDAQALLEMKNQLQSHAGEEQKITLTDILIKACAIALRRHPEINSQFNGASVRRFHEANIGIAVAGQGTLLVPVIRSCQCKSIGQIALDRANVVEKGQAGKLSVDEMSGGTFTISNLGMMGITRFCAVINPPQAAILAVGTVRDEPVVKDGAVVPGKRMSLTMSCDHRVFDGAEGARFLATIKKILENPMALCL